jgi:hypothetical protein
MASIHTLVPKRTAARSRTKQKPRAHQRVSVATTGDLVSLEGNRQVLVVNLCEQGAMVEMTMPPPLEAEVLLFFGDIQAEGNVVWRGPEHCGIRFHEPIEHDAVDCEALWSRKLLDHLLAR